MSEKGYHNYMEDVVLGLLDSSIRDLNICKCEKCKIDVMAIALNELEPKYVVSSKGMCYTQLNHVNPQFEASVVAAIVKAAEKVGKKPNHGTK